MVRKTFIALTGQQGKKEGRKERGRPRRRDNEGEVRVNVGSNEGVKE